MVNEICEVVGSDFDTHYIVKILEKHNYDMEKTVDALLDYKDKLEERKNKVKPQKAAQLPAKPTGQAPAPVNNAAPAKSQSLVQKQGTPNKQSEKPKKQVDEPSSPMITDEYSRKNSRKFSKDEIKELPLDKKNWNTVYPLINYSE